MKTKDIMTALGNVSDEYKREAEEENAGRYFKERKGKTVFKNIIKYSLSAAAIFALAVFMIAVAKTKYADQNNMVASGSGVKNSVSETTIERGIVNENGNLVNIDEVKINVCELQGGEPKEIGRDEVKNPDHVIYAASNVVDASEKYRCIKNDAVTDPDTDSYMCLAKFEDGEEKWRIDYNGAYGPISDYIELENENVLILSHARRYRTERFAALQMYDKNGQTVWGPVELHEKYDEFGYRVEALGLYAENGIAYLVCYEVNEDVVEYEPGKYSVYGEALNKLMIVEFSLETGQELSRKYKETNLYAQLYDVDCIGMTEAGFVIVYQNKEWETRVMLVDRDCSIVGINSYGRGYEFYSAESHNGKIYLSGKLMQPEINMYYDMYFPDPGLIYYKAAVNSSSNNEKLVKKFREETSAVLLVCDTSLRPTHMYTQKAAFGAKLYKTEDGLVWDVCEISYAGRPIMAGGSVSYSFNKNGLLTSREDNGEIYASVGGMTAE